uniref:Uncharacterized protein n=1 Tax=Arundo donax TaxID=35708 RepID=A0A0A8Z5W9_ARUDO
MSWSSSLFPPTTLILILPAPGSSSLL